MLADSCPGYAVFDVETTGLYPSRHDRIIEIAIVHLDLSGKVTGEWCTLLNPVRDLGRQDIHGIKAADVLTAPAFEHVAGTAATMMAGRIPVAHNIAFDVMFLAAEYARLNTPVPLRADLGLCTMGLARRFLQVTRRSLDTCCAAAGITMRHHHDALSDAHAAAALLSRYLLLAGDSPPWAPLMSQVAQHPWPTLPASDVPPVLRGHATSRSEHFLARIADQLPRVPDPPEADSYLAVLDQALIDRHISVTEANQLVALARHLGLTRDIVAGLHQDYLQALATAAWEDGVVTDDERADLLTVARLLGLAASDVDNALHLAREITPGPRPSTITKFALQPGDQIVLTGEMIRPRPELEALAREAGLAVHGNITKKTRLLIAADPDSLSGKARKAQTYGIPIIAEPAFLSMIGDMTR